MAGQTIDSKLILTFQSGNPIEIPIEVKVQSFELPEPDVDFAYLGSTTLYPSASHFVEIAAKQASELIPMLEVLKAHGMTTVTGGLSGPKLTGCDSQGDPIMDFAEADATMARIKNHFGRSVNSYGGFEIGGLNMYSPQITAYPSSTCGSYAEILAKVVTAIRAHATENNWLPVVYNVGDEPSGAGIDASKAVGDAFTQANPNTKTSVFTSITSSTTDYARLVESVDLLILNQHSEAGIQYIRDQGKEFALYNRGTRYRIGVYLHKLREFGVTGHFQFAAQSVGADPYYALDAREDDYCAVFTHKSAILIPTVSIERRREGVDDLRYLLKLEQLLRTASASDAKVAAAAFMADLKASIAIGSEQTPAYAENELNALRREVAQHIEAILGGGQAIPDAGMPMADGGTSPNSDGAIGSDAAPTSNKVDAGAQQLTPTTNDDCGCNTTAQMRATSEPALVLLFILVCGYIRQRRSQRR